MKISSIKFVGKIVITEDEEFILKCIAESTTSIYTILGAWNYTKVKTAFRIFFRSGKNYYYLFFGQWTN